MATSETEIYSPLNYPYNKYFLLPNVITRKKLSSGSLKIYQSTNNNDEDNIRKSELVLEPYLPNVERMCKSNKIQLILDRVQRNPIGAEFKITLFITSCWALNIGMLDKHLQKESKKFIRSLDHIPAINNFNNTVLLKLPDNIIDALYWLLIGLRRPKITVLDKLREKSLLEEFNAYNGRMQPLVICRLCGNKLKMHNALSGVHSVMEYGFLAVNNNEVFSLLFNWKYSGKERCFNDKFQHAYNFATLQPVWRKCTLGRWIKIILVIQYYMHPTITYVGDLPGHSLSLCLELPSSNPPAYYQISNVKFARVSHILIYRTNYSYYYEFKATLKYLYEFYGSIFYCVISAIILAALLRKIRLNSIW